MRPFTVAVTCFGVAQLVGFVMPGTDDLSFHVPNLLLTSPAVIARWFGFDLLKHHPFEKMPYPFLFTASGLFRMNDADAPDMAEEKIFITPTRMASSTAPTRREKVNP